MPFDLATPFPRTWLSLPRYARILGINPVHFQGAVGTSVWPLAGNNCSNVWPRYSWQNSDQVSLDDLARAIKDAEDEIEAFIGYPLCPTWYTNENHRYTQHHRPDGYGLYGRNQRHQRKSVKTKHSKVIAPGRRSISLLGTATTGGGSLAYSDEDSDGFAETATITLATALADTQDMCQVKVYFADNSGSQSWEIRPSRRKSISGGTVTLVFDSWLFIDPELQAAQPSTEGYAAIDVTTTANYVTSVDIYLETNDNTVVTAQFFWEPCNEQVFCTSCSGAGCTECTFTTQDGCLLVRDVENGYVVPSPATYGSGVWTRNALSVARDPDQVKIWYYAGEMDEAFLSGDSCDPLSHFFAQPIAWIATARLERDFCQCGNVTALAAEWKVDLTHQGESSHLIDFNLLDAPFGTRRGELMAWKRLSMLGRRKISSGII
jgi:hypothetical protein